MNAYNEGQNFMDETGCMAYTSYAYKVDENMKHNSYKSMNALKLCITPLEI
jgi:hypothetical protein